MTNQKALTLIKIKQNIDINLNADYDGFWQNRTKVLDELKTKNPKKFFKDINNLKGKGPNDQGSYLQHNDATITNNKDIADTFA